MTRRSTYLLAAGALLIVLAAAWVAVPRTPAPEAPTAASQGSGVLDGMTFEGVLGLVGEPGDVKDTLVFENGTFRSTECDLRCGYPARPYYVRRLGDKIEFVSESRCLYKDAKIVWRGTVDGGTIEGVSTWTVNRWYWTIKKQFWFEGTLAEGVGPLAERR